MNTEFLIALARHALKVSDDNRFADVRVREDGLQLTITDRTSIRKRTVSCVLLYDGIGMDATPPSYIEKIFAQLELELDR